MLKLISYAIQNYKESAVAAVNVSGTKTIHLMTLYDRSHSIAHIRSFMF